MKKIALLLTLLLCSAAASAQLNIVKSCDASANVGDPITCNFTVDNSSGIPGPNGRATNLQVRNTVPFPGGTTTIIPCLISGIPVTALDDGQSCTGTFTETAPGCSGITFTDEIVATAHINAFGDVSGLDDRGVTITGGSTCTPTPSPTNTPTPTNTLTPTATTLRLEVIKSCPTASQTPGSSYTCNFSIRNLINYTVTSLSVLEQSWDQTNVPQVCTQLGLPVTSLGPAGSLTDTCTGTMTDTVPACGVGGAYISTDELDAYGIGPRGISEYGGRGLGQIAVPSCGAATNTPTPTPTITGTLTPTVTGTPPTATNTPTNTPSRTPTPTITVPVTFTPATATPSPTHTPIPTIAIVTFTPTSTPSRTPTFTPSITPSTTPTPTVTPTPPPQLAVTKTCPTNAARGTLVKCTFSVTNLDTANEVTQLTVQNVYPIFPFHSALWPCGGASVRTLGKNGTATATCTGIINEVMDLCDGGNPCLGCGGNTGDNTCTDVLTATGFKTGFGYVSGSTTKVVAIQTCTNTPTLTPSRTRTPTRTPTPTPRH